MATVSSTTSLSGDIRELLDQVRGRIRSYVWVDGFAKLFVWLGLAFWISLGFDWWVEPPAVVNYMVLAAALAGAVWIVVRYLVNRVRVPMRDASMAVVLERKYRQFGDSLLTSVELEEQPEVASQFNPDMMVHTRRMAEEATGQVLPGELLRWGPLGQWVLGAVALVASIVALAIFAPGVLSIWFNRVALGSSMLWPRDTVLNVEGFEHGPIKVGRGGDYVLTVTAETPWENAHRIVPKNVQVRYNGEDGHNMRENMTREGEAIPPQDHVQRYRFTFQGINSDVNFYAVGGDARTPPYRIEVVKNPEISEAKMDMVYPDYFRRPAKLDTEATSGRLPCNQGARITLRAKVNKPAQRIFVSRLDGQKQIALPESGLTLLADQQHFTYIIDRLDDDLTLEFHALDTDGIKTRSPYRVTLAVVPDDPPEVKMRLRSIGMAVTPDALLPATGTLSDRIGLAKAWFEYQITSAAAAADPNKRGADSATVIRPFVAKIDNQQELEFKAPKRDTDSTRERADGLPEESLDVRDLNLEPGAKLGLVIKSSDHCNLRPEPNVGAGERYQLDIVTPQQLRSILEARELTFRRRFETMVSEMTDTRDSLGRIKFKAEDKAAKPADAKPDKKSGAEPEDSVKAKPAGGEPGDPSNAPPSQEVQRAMRAQRGIANAQRSREEVRLLGLDFDDLREEMINNRIDTEELRTRLGQKIIQPLNLITSKSLPEFEVRLLRFAQNNNPESGPAALEAAKEQGDLVLRQMDQVLKNMLELEDYNQLVESLRQIVEWQERLTGHTLQQQKERARKLLEE